MQWMKQILINFFSLILSQMQALMLSGTSAIKFWEHPVKGSYSWTECLLRIALRNFGDTKAENNFFLKKKDIKEIGVRHVINHLWVTWITSDLKDLFFKYEKHMIFILLIN